MPSRAAASTADTLLERSRPVTGTVTGSPLGVCMRQTSSPTTLL